MQQEATLGDPERPATADVVAFHLNPAWARWLMVIMGVTFGIWGLASLPSPSEIRTGGFTVGNVAQLAFWLGWLLFAVRWWRCELRADDAGVRIRNLLRSRSMAWDQISALRDSSWSHRGGTSWILAVADTQGRVIKPLASVNAPARQASQLARLGRRHGLHVSLSPFRTTMASKRDAAQPLAPGWYSDPIARYPVRYRDANGWTTVVASLDDSGRAAVVSRDEHGLPNLPWLPVGGWLDTADAPAPPPPR
jgi:hypothetical protein